MNMVFISTVSIRYVTSYSISFIMLAQQLLKVVIASVLCILLSKRGVGVGPFVSQTLVSGTLMILLHILTGERRATFTDLDWCS